MRFQEKVIPSHLQHGRYMSENFDFKDHSIDEGPYQKCAKKKSQLFRTSTYVLI